MDDPLPTETRCAFDAVSTSLVVLGLILAITAMRHAGATAPTDSAPRARASINPNTAPWWELLVLPGIGETTARKIVEYREANSDQGRVFRDPADLEPVSGIGPKTIQRIGPYLRFAE